MKVGQGPNFSRNVNKSSNFKVSGNYNIIAIWQSMATVVTNILMYYMNSYTNYS